MHMRLPALHLPLFKSLVEGRDPATLLALVVVLCTVPPGSTRAQAEFPGAPDEASANLRIYPLDTWSPRVGVGVGAGLVLHHFGRTNARALLTFAPARHEQVATAGWASAHPKGARQYVLVDARGLHTDRDWFYGLGPASRRGARQALARSALQVRIRGGQAVLDHRLLVQPFLGLSAHQIDRVPTPTASTLSSRSRRHLQQLGSDDLGPLHPEQTGLRVGLQTKYDSRAQQSSPSPGILLQGTWSRYVDLTSSFVRFDQVDLGVYGSVLLRERHRLAGRVLLTLTENRGRASVPYYLRPTLDGRFVPGWARGRFVASDRLIGSLLYRFPLAEVMGVFEFEGHLGLHAASVYDDFPSDAAFALTFEDTVDPGRLSVPLRPSASAGLHVGLSFREVPSMDLALGLSPEGLTAVRFTFTQKIQALRPPHHHSIRRH